MNKVILMGRLTREPEVRYSAGDNGTAYARYGLAVDRRFNRRNDDPNAKTVDFFNCVVFGRGAEFAEKYLHQGTKILVSGRIETGSYTNRDGQKVNTVDIIVEEQEFAESKAAAANRGVNTGAGADNFAPYSRPAAGGPSAPAPMEADPGDGFMNIPDGIDEELPFN